MTPHNAQAVRALRSVGKRISNKTDPIFEAVAVARKVSLTWAQIAEALDIPTATAKSRYAGGLAGLEARRAAARERAKRRPVVRVPAATWAGVSLAEAGEVLGVSSETVRRRVHLGHIRGGFEVDGLGRRALRVTEDFGSAST